MSVSSYSRRVGRAVTYSAVALISVAAALAVWIGLGRSFPAPLPPPTGPRAVGRTEFDWQDEARADPFDPARKRELDMLVWYPAERAGGTRAPYVRENWLRGIRRPFPMPQLYRVQTHSWTDAPVGTPERGRWPVVILGSGFGALPSDYTVLAEELASRGYVVAAPANTYSGVTVVFPDGRVADEVEKLPPNDDLVRIWAGDIESVIKRLAALDEDPSSLFHHKLELTRLAIVGHSFGGAAAAQFCAADPRCAVAIDLDGALYGEPLKNGVRAKFLLLVSDGTTSFFSSAGQKESWAKTYREYIAVDQATCRRSQECRVVVERGFRHANFTDSAALFRAPLVWVHPSLGAADPVEGLNHLRREIVETLESTMKPD